MFSVNKIFHWIRSPYSLITLTIILVLHACEQGSFKNYKSYNIAAYQSLQKILQHKRF